VQKIFFASFERQLYVGEQTAHFIVLFYTAPFAQMVVLDARGECVPPTFGVEAGAILRLCAIDN